MKSFFPQQEIKKKKKLSCFQPSIFDKLLVQRECGFSLAKIKQNKQIPYSRLLRKVMYLILIGLGLFK